MKRLAFGLAFLALAASCGRARPESLEELRLHSQRAQACRTEKATEYARATAESPQDIAEAAVEVCEDKSANGIPFTAEQLDKNPYPYSEYAKLTAGDREREIRRLKAVVIETRAKAGKSQDTTSTFSDDTAAKTGKHRATITGVPKMPAAGPQQQRHHGWLRGVYPTVTRRAPARQLNANSLIVLP